MSDLLITIDGPAGSGKTTVARWLSMRLCAVFLDTGAMYRAVTLAAMGADVDLADEEKLLEVLENTDFEFGIGDDSMVIFINDVDVTDQIRLPRVTANVHYIASRSKLRSRLVEMQREFAIPKHKIVTEGRDQGTVAFADADVKFFLTADIAERARRRYDELVSKGNEENLDQIQQAMEDRDRSDERRTVGPLVPAADAIIIDTTYLAINEVVAMLLDWIEKKCPKKN